MSGPLRTPVVVGLGRGVGTSTVTCGLHAQEGTDRDSAADVVVCTDLAAAAAVTTARAGTRPVLAVTTTAGGPAPVPARLRALESRFVAVVLLPHVERWDGRDRSSDEVAPLLGQAFDHLSRPLQSYAAALRLVTAAVLRSGLLTMPAPPMVVRPRSVELWRGLLPVERTAEVRPILLAAPPRALAVPVPTVSVFAALGGGHDVAGPDALRLHDSPHDDEPDDDALEAAGAGRAG